MRILFIGGSGNISTACVELLLHRGHEVAAITRGTRPLPDGCAALVADRHDPDAMKAVLGDARFDAVINFLGFDAPEIEADLDLFASRTGHYVFISSATVYAKPHRDIPLTENAPLGNAYSEYAARKLACEQALQARAPALGLPFTIVRPSHTYSPHWIPNIVASAGYGFAARLLAGKPVFVPDNGQGLWTLTRSADFAVGLAGLLTNQQAFGKAYHITADEPLTWNQIYTEIAWALGLETPEMVHIPSRVLCDTRPDLIPKLRGDKCEPGIFDNAAIKDTVREFGEHLLPFRHGIRESIAWFDKHPEAKVPNPELDAVYDELIAAWSS